MALPIYFSQKFTGSSSVDMLSWTACRTQTIRAVTSFVLKCKTHVIILAAVFSPVWRIPLSTERSTINEVRIFHESLICTRLYTKYPDWVIKRSIRSKRVTSHICRFVSPFSAWLVPFPSISPLTLVTT